MPPELAEVLPKSIAYGDRYFIPARPETFNLIQDEIAKPEPDIMRVAELVSGDVSLSGEVLKLINSPFYGLGCKISDINQSVMLIGLDALNTMVIGSFLKRGFKKTYSIKLERFWDEASTIASSMMFLGDRLEAQDEHGELFKDKIPLESLYALGLFHDCGIPPLAEKHADYRELLVYANGNLKSSVELEDRSYKTTHTAVGYYICKYWGLPKRICNLVLRHHESDYLEVVTDPVDQVYFAILKMAENMTYKQNQGVNAPEWAAFSDQVFARLGLSNEEYGELCDAFLSLDSQTER